MSRVDAIAVPSRVNAIVVPSRVMEVGTTYTTLVVRVFARVVV